MATTETRTAVMDEYLDSPMEGEDVFPCKGCGDILEEGKAFELAGNRWHLDCFRCNTCGTLLDSDANLLLLGDGSLICNNCTYSCSACGDKIEDLAILTGEQAFCATCFRCRNCKRKIENLRYARTSQGIFCMSCHESLMARRRKKSKAAAQAKAREKEGSPMVHEKSLPALPPSAIPPNAFSNDRVEPDSDTPTELSPRPRPSYHRNESSSRSSSRPARSPERPSEREGGLSLPSTTYRKNNRNSAVFPGAEVNTQAAAADDQGFFIPVALDPSPGPSAASGEGQKAKDKDYFSLSKSSSVKEKKAAAPSAAHIAFQSQGRQPSSEYDSSPARDMSRNPSKSSRRERNGTTSSPANDDRSVDMVNGKPSQNTDFKLQDAPKSKKTTESRSNSQPTGSPDGSISRASGSSNKEKESSRPTESSQHLQSGDVTLTPRSSQDSRRKEDGEGSSANISAGSNHAKSASKAETPQPPKNAQPQLSVSTKPQPQNHDDLISPPVPPRHGAPADHSRQDSQATQKAPTRGTRKDQAQSAAGNHEDPQTSPKLPRWSAGGDFTMDEDMARILGTDEAHPHRASHGRSVSENHSPWPKGAADDDDDDEVSSAIIMGTGEDSALLKSRLRTSEQRVAELERQFTNEKDLKSISKKLEEKRKTVSVLDTQTEIMIRQLETLAGYVERAKDTKKPIDPRELEESALKDFVQRLEKLKQSMSASLEQLHRERDDVQRDRDQMADEKERAVVERDRARLEFEQLVSKNAQLADLNNDLTHQIQERFKNNSDGGRQAINGLGIYNHHHKGTSSNHSVNLDSSSIQTGTTVVAPEHEEPIVEGPTVVKINKGQVKKFNWKKGSKAMAQRIGQGVNRTVVAFQQPERHQGMPGDNIGMPYNTTHTIVESPVVQNPNGQMNRNQPGPGFFGFKKSTTMPTNNRMPGMTMAAEAAEAPSVLFGSELSERADFERRQIPCVVTRCIEEVELRGMDMEGIYRKTGGNSQTKIIQEGFDKNENFDISDPDLDITAVTSVLKQYFRKLPTPLLTYDVYDRVLETNTINNDHEKWAHLRSVFDQLPRQHKDCLEFLMFHLSRVASREGENLMTPKNLAVVFAPTIMRDLNIEREMTDMHAKNLAVQYIIENSQNIFV